MTKSKIERDGEVWHGYHEPGDVSMSGVGGKAFFRRSIKLNACTGEQRRTEWLVGELDGVRVYVCGRNVIVTREDLYP